MSLGLTSFSPNPSRREFLKLAALGTGAALLPASATAAISGDARRLVDVNVSLGPWPFRRVHLDQSEHFAAKLRSRGVTQAWTGSLEALLHKDIGAANERLAATCRKHGRGVLLPFGCVNPKLPGWERDFHQCLQVHHFRGIRLYPNYHGYRLDDPGFARLLGLAAEHGVIVQIAVVMEDERMMHPLVRVEPVDLTPLSELVRQIPRVRVVLLNALRTLRGQPLQKLIAAGDFSVEISMLEGVGGIAGLLGQVPCERILFGSHTPVFYFEAAGLKLKESPLTPEQDRLIGFLNAQALLEPLSRRGKTAHR